MAAFDPSNAEPIAAVKFSELDPRDDRFLSEAGLVGYEAFRQFSVSVGQPPEFTSAAEYRGLLEALLTLDNAFALKATVSDDTERLVGSVIMHCIDRAVAAIGPISTHSTATRHTNSDNHQAHTHIHIKSVGRQLMQRCIDNAHKRGLRSIRLVQIASNIRSYSLYHKLGFNPREFMVELRGLLNQKRFDEFEDGIVGLSKRVVRSLTPDDLAECDSLHIETNVVSRLASLRVFTSPPYATESLKAEAKTEPRDGETSALVCVERDGGRIVGYTSGYSLEHHSVGIDDHAIVSLYHHQSVRMDQLGIRSVMFINGIRNPQALRYLMELGAQCQRQVCLMVHGDYHPPNKNIYCPSVLW